MVNEEVSGKACNLAVRTTKLTLQVIINALKEQARKAEQRKLHKTDEPPHGKQTIKELIGQGQGVASVDVSKTELKGFQKIAKKYGVDFAVVKDKNNEPPIYTVFFKAKDQDAINNVIREYTNKKMKQKSMPSVLEKLKEFKDMVAKRPVKQKTRKKEATR